MQSKGIITEVKISATDNKNRKTIKIDGVLYSLFEKIYNTNKPNPNYSLAQEDNNIEFEYTEKESGDTTYRNITKIKILSAVSDKTNNAVSENNYINNKQKSIDLAVCFKGAIELFKDIETGEWDEIIKATKKFYAEIFQNRENGDKLKELSEMNDMVIEIMRMGSEGVWDKDEFDNIRKGVEKRNRNYEELKKLYLNARDDFNARIDKRKEEAGDIPF